jgi:hypothetical protein
MPDRTRRLPPPWLRGWPSGDGYDTLTIENVGNYRAGLRVLSCRGTVTDGRKWKLRDVTQFLRIEHARSRPKRFGTVTGMIYYKNVMRARTRCCDCVSR